MDYDRDVRMLRDNPVEDGAAQFSGTEAGADERRLEPVA
jgi:hypothetical protein